MGWIKRLSYVFIIGIVLCCRISFAQEIKYSIGPICKNNKVICTSSNETPTCVVLNPKIHLETITSESGIKTNRFQPYCDAYPSNLLPTCIDLNMQGKIARGVVVDCVELVKCKINKDTNKLAATCTSGKIPKCLGNDSTPNCEAEALCRNASIPVCDYAWQAYVPKSSFR